MRNLIKFLIVIFIFVFGIAVGTSNTSTVKVKDELSAKDLAQCQSNLSKYKSLKEIDDKGFDLSSTVFTETSDVFAAIAIGDYKTANEIINRVGSYASKINEVAVERQKVLKELGYGN